MRGDFVSELDGYPQARQVTLSDGTPAYHVEVPDFCPEAYHGLPGKMVTRFLLGFVPLAALAAIDGLPLILRVALIALGIAVGVGLCAFAGKDRTAPVEVLVTERAFSFGKGSDWLRFDRTVEHTLRMQKHDAAKEEERDERVLIAKDNLAKRARKHPAIYQASYHIIYEHFGQRHDIAVVYHEAEAQQVVAKLALLDRLANNLRRKGAGAAFDPDDDWAEQPGDI